MAGEGRPGEDEGGEGRGEERGEAQGDHAEVLPAGIERRSAGKPKRS